MKPTSLGPMAAGLALTIAFAACGSSIQASATSTGSGGATTSSSSTSSGTTTATGSGGSGGQAATDGGVDAPDDAPFVPGTFDCNGCLCDGATHFCQMIFAGAQNGPPPGPPPEPVCADDAGTDCVPLPDNCGGVPSCDCVTMPACECAAAAGGVTVKCFLP